MDITELIRQCYEMNMALKEENLIVLNFGNASIFDPDKQIFAIKPSGIFCKDLTPDDIVILNLKGDVVQGNRRPSSDTPTHLYFYQHFRGITSVVHTHSIYAAAWAEAGRDIPVYGTTHADFMPAAIPCTDPLTPDQIAGEYEWETGAAVERILAERNLTPDHCPMCNVRGHGPFTWSSGKTPALQNAVAMEAIAKMAFIAEHLNPACQTLQPELIDRHYYRKHGKNAYYGQDNYNH